MAKQKFDLIIIGTGPAGLTSAIYASRYRLNTLVIGEIVGGMAVMATKICNYPGYEEIKGFELAKKIREQVKNLDVDIKLEKVLSIEKLNGIFKVRTNNKSYKSRKIILTIGREIEKLNLENETNFLGKGISYCANCDAILFKDKITAVIGGGNSALNSALLLAEFAKKVFIIYRRDKFSRADPILVEKIKENKKIEAIFNANVKELIGENKLEKIKLEKKELKIDGLFVEIGAKPNLEIVKNLNLELENGYIKTDKEQKTNVRGVFAAGDVTNNPLKQIITACGEGAVAAKSAFEELKILK